MKLTEYLKLIDRKPTRWAKEKGLSPATVWRIVTDKTFPDPDTIRAVEKATDGAVQPSDWF